MVSKEKNRNREVHQDRPNIRGSPNAKPLTDGAQDQRTKYYIIDTCYLIDLIKSGRSVKSTITFLKERGAEVILTKQVFDELTAMKNRVFTTKQESEAYSRAVGEIWALIGEQKITYVQQEISDEIVRKYSERMASISPDNNSRLGLGDASILHLIDHLREDPDRICVLSKDSDLGNFARTEYVQ